MRTLAASPLLKVIGSIVILLGVAVVVLVAARAIPAALPAFGWGSTLLVAVPMVAFGGYITYLGYSFLSGASRSAFAQIWFQAVILVIVVINRHVSLLAGFPIAAGLGLLSVVLQPFITRRLFRDRRDV